MKGIRACPVAQHISTECCGPITVPHGGTRIPVLISISHTDIKNACTGDASATSCIRYIYLLSVANIGVSFGLAKETEGKMRVERKISPVGKIFFPNWEKQFRQSTTSGSCNSPPHQHTLHMDIHIRLAHPVPIV